MTHVLIVEDLEDGRYLLKAMLEGNGYRVTEARDGLEALIAARSDPPDVIVSDALMPTMDGFTLCRAWMQNAALRAIPFIFYSATYTSPEDEKLALALGAVRYLIKPQEPETFLAELTTVLQKWVACPAPGPSASMDAAEFHARHETVVTYKLESKLAQLEATNRELHKSEEKYRQLFETSRDALIVQEPPSWRFTDANQAALDLFGVASKADFRALRPLALSPERQPDGRPSAEKALEMIAATEREGSTFFEWESRRLNGASFTAEVLLTRMEKDGRVLLQTMVRDITERKQAELQLRKLSLAVEQSPESI
jgi:PAS domain S-box-containing protein